MRERIGKAEEELDAAGRASRTVGDLIGWLAGRGEKYAYAFENPAVIRAAIDHVHARHDAADRGRARDRLLPADDGRLRWRGVPVQAEEFRRRGRDRRHDGAGRTDIGAVVTFTGLCRDEGGTLAALEIEHYPGMAEAEIGRVAAEAEARWPLQGCRVIHRFGAIAPGPEHRLGGDGLGHRAAAFAAADS